MALTFSSDSLYSRITPPLNKTIKNLSTSVERLSTGLRINSAKDDPAGLAVSESYRAKMAATLQGLSNLEEGVNLLQTAENGLALIDEQLIRMKELAEQASTETYTDEQRLIMHSEFSLMGAEIDRIAGATAFNTNTLLDGSLAASSLYQTSGGWNEPDEGMLIHFGPNNNRAEDYYYVSIQDSRSNYLFQNQTVAISTAAAAQNAISYIDTAIVRKENTRAFVGALQTRLESTITVMDNNYASLDDAESNIMDADIALEMASLVKNQVILQSAVSMLAQANVLPQQALSLLS